MTNPVILMVSRQELDEVSNELSKAKMTSVRPAKPYSPTGREQHIQQLHQKLKLVNDGH